MKQDVLISVIACFNPINSQTKDNPHDITNIRFLTETMIPDNFETLYLACSENINLEYACQFTHNIIFVDNHAQYAQDTIVNSNIIIIKDQNIFAVYNMISEFLTKKNTQIDTELEKYISTYVDNIKVLLNMAYELLHNPVLILDMHGNHMLSQGLENLQNPAITSKLQKGELKLSLDADHVASSTIQSCDFFGDIHNIITYKTTFNHQQQGLLVLVENEHTFCTKDHQYLDQISKLIFNENNHYVNEEKNIKRRLLKIMILNLMEKKLYSTPIIHAFLKRTSYTLNPNLFIMSIDINDTSISNNVLINALDSQSTICFAYKKQLIVLIHTLKWDFYQSDDFVKIEDILKGWKLVAGISPLFKNLADLSAHYDKSIVSAQLGQYSTKNKYIYIYEHYAMYHMVAKMAKTTDILEFCHPRLIKLVKYDKQHHTEYTFTLYTLLASKGNQAAASKKLYIHRSSIIYRLKRIEELTGFDINDLGDILRLNFSFIILKLSGLLDTDKFTGLV